MVAPSNNPSWGEQRWPLYLCLGNQSWGPQAFCRVTAETPTPTVSQYTNKGICDLSTTLVPFLSWSQEWGQT